jgi:hypothetical protein
MHRVHAFAAFAFAVILVGAQGDRADAQSPISAVAIKAAETAAGTAKVVDARIVAGDSLIVSIEDPQFTFGALMAGEWRLGGREETPRAAGRAISEAIRSALPARSPVRVIVVHVVGSGIGRPQVRFPYSTADRAPRL